MKNTSEVTLMLVTLLKLAFTSDVGNETRECINAMTTIRNLVNPEKYDKSMRPCENGEPVEVRAGLYIVSINKIEESDMQYDIQVYFRQKWRDHRLAFDWLNLTREDYIEISPGNVSDAIWMPDPYFENEKSAKVHTVMRKNQFLRLYSNGNVFYSTRLTLTLSCPMEFYDFPMDHQICKMTFLSYSHSTGNLIYKWMTNKTETSVYSNKLELPQFKIKKIEIGNRIDSYTVGDFTVLTLYLHLHRRLEFYLTRNYIPAALVVIVSWLSFWLDRDCAPARVGMGITTILTMTTLLIGIGQQELPVVSYIKALDWYYIGCFTFVFAALCEYAVVNYFDRKYRKQVAKLRMKVTPLNEGEAEINPNEYFERNGFGLDKNFPPKKSSQLCQEKEAKPPEHLTSQSQLSDVIDRSVRNVYPLLFLVFNVAYWRTFWDSFDI